MLKIDAHQHFWKYNPVRDSWIDDNMSVIQRDFFPEHLEPVLKQNGIDGSVVVQSDQSADENKFQLNNAKDHPFVKGVIGWVDFQSNDIEDQLMYFQQFPVMKGFRHMLQSETMRGFMLQTQFKKGIHLLHKYNFTYDILILPDQLSYTNEFVSLFPDQLFIIDHIAKPPIKERSITEWKKEIVAIASHENVFCKVSGLITEADWLTWKPADLIPYIDVIVNSFGTKRILFGSDWPVCLLAGSYEKMLSVVKDYFSSFSKNEQDLFFGGNAIRFYNL